jgi:aspartyl-tRNA(Asn)/glutamyl-tRNA(Gln) amidotransferase subunit C
MVYFASYYSRNCNNRGDFGQGANVLSLRPQRAKGAYIRCTSMSIDQDEIEKIAELARIRIADDQIGEVTRRITGILGMVDQLQSVDTRDVIPMANPLDATARLRADEVTQTNLRDDFQAIAPAVENGLYLVPKVID